MNEQELAMAKTKLEAIRKELEGRSAELGFDPVKALDYESMLADIQHLRSEDHQDAIFAIGDLIDVNSMEFCVASSGYEEDDREFFLTVAGVDHGQGQQGQEVTIQ